MKPVAHNLSTWHNGPRCQRTFVPGYGGIGVKVCCAPCGAVCDVEALGLWVSVNDSYHYAPVTVEVSS